MPAALLCGGAAFKWKVVPTLMGGYALSGAQASIVSVRGHVRVFIDSGRRNALVASTAPSVGSAVESRNAVPGRTLATVRPPWR